MKIPIGAAEKVKVKSPASITKSFNPSSNNTSYSNVYSLMKEKSRPLFGYNPAYDQHNKNS